MEIKTTQLPGVVQAKIEFPVWLSWVTVGLMATGGEVPRVLTHLQGNLTRGRRSTAERSLLQQQNLRVSGAWPALACAEVLGKRREGLSSPWSITEAPGSKASQGCGLGPYTEPETLITGGAGPGGTPEDRRKVLASAHPSCPPW